MHNELAVQDGLVFKGNSIVIPKSLCADMKLKICSSHLGIEACLRHACECIYWPGMSAEMKHHISMCETFRELDSTSHAKETLMSLEVPSCPWGKIATDIFTLDGKDYQASATILKLKSHFARYGIPDQVVSDSGLITEFYRKWDFEHLTSSPGNSKANGKAESGVKTAKRILKKSINAGTNPYLVILGYRNTPTEGMTTSPAQRLMSRRTKTLLPTTQSLLLLRTINLEGEKKELRQCQQDKAKYYNRSAKDLPSLSESNVVRMKPFKLGNKCGPGRCKA